MKKAGVFVLVGLCLVVGAALAQQQKPEGKTTAARYQLVPAQITFSGPEGTATYSRVFLLDTQSGQTWEYQQAVPTISEDRKTVLSVIPGRFTPVEIVTSGSKR